MLINNCLNWIGATFLAADYNKKQIRFHYFFTHYFCNFNFIYQRLFTNLIGQNKGLK